MSRPFPEAAREALKNTQLRHNLRVATHTIRAKRDAVVSEVPDWEALRDQGARIKEAAMRHLDVHLEQLERSVTAAGGTVHWARDAGEANATVARLVREAGSREAIKVKSLATDEIGLNEALAREGITAHETDLAELIVQLGHDRQSHILVPAIHRNRAEIRELFRRELPGTEDLTDEPAALAEAARRHLRERFLSVGVGISGANFAVAETGTVCVVESEGNGRMCTTLPRVLITVMGIEKVLPRFADLGVMLQLLPRSSTGERMNPYTSLWTGVTPGDGPEAFHLVLLDAGRTDVLADPIGRQALHCIRCSACLNVCPVYERTGGHAYESTYPGPIGAILTPQLAGVAAPRRRCRGPRRCAARATRSARSRSTSPSVLVHLRGRVVREAKGDGCAGTAGGRAAGDGGDGACVREPPALRGRATGGAGRRVALVARREDRAPPARSAGGWTQARDLPVPRGVVPRLVAAVSARDEILGADPHRARRRARRSSRADAYVDPSPPRPRRRPLRRAGRRLPRDRRARAGRRGRGRRRRRCERHGARRLVAPDGLPDDWRTGGRRARHRHGRGTTRAGRVATADGVLTDCALAIAETGTIVLDAGARPGPPRAHAAARPPRLRRPPTASSTACPTRSPARGRPGAR